jgi:hypothetical protein
MPSDADLFLVCPSPGRLGLTLTDGEASGVSLKGCGAVVSRAPWASQYSSRIVVCFLSVESFLVEIRN